MKKTKTMKKRMPFDIEKAKAGAKLETRDGRPARIVCYDKKSDYFPLLALITEDYGENPVAYASNGHYCGEGSKDSVIDLVIVEEVEDIE